MGNQGRLNRRNFMKVAGATSGLALASGYAATSYAANEKIRVGMIGVGGQANWHLRNGIGSCPDLEVVAICDVLKVRQDACLDILGGPDAVPAYYDYRQMIDEVEMDAVIICTPLFEHYEPAKAALEAGLHCFVQKTMCYEIEECRSLIQLAHDKGLVLQVGHQRRYNPEYNKAMWLIRGSEERPSATGRVNHINAYWHRNNSWRRPIPSNYEMNETEKKLVPRSLEEHYNWRLYPQYSKGGLITELATHQLDIATWALGTPPSRVSAFGGIDYWRDGREVNDNIVMIYEFEISRQHDGFKMIRPRVQQHKMSQINRDYTVRMTYTSICANRHREYGEWIAGDQGGIELTEQFGCRFYPDGSAAADWKRMEEEKMKEATAEEQAKEIAAGGTRNWSGDAAKEGIPIEVVDDLGQPFEITANDRMQFTAFAKHIREGGQPKNNGMVGLMAACAGFAALESMKQGGQPVEIDPALYTFDFETPDPYQYEFFPDPAGWDAAKKEEEDDPQQV